MDALARDADTAPGTETKAGAEAKSLGAPALMQWVKRHLIFVLTVGVPTLGATLYFGLIASDVFISESRFLVRSPKMEMPTQSGLVGDLLQGAGFTRLQDDTYSVRDFILSRDALKELDDKLGVRKAYSSRNIDIFEVYKILP